MNKRQRKKHNESYSYIQMYITPGGSFKWETPEDILDYVIEHAELAKLSLGGSFDFWVPKTEFIFSGFVTSEKRAIPIEHQVNAWVAVLRETGLSINLAQFPTEVDPRTYKVKQKKEEV